jgi:hypothetical protein
MLLGWIFRFKRFSNFLKKLKKIQIFGVLVMALKKLSLYLSLSFHINFKQRKLSLLRICMTIERESERDKKRERAFLKAFSPKLQILKFNLKSTSDSKILKIWI